MSTVALICLILIFSAVGMNLIRIIRGPSPADRALALDAIFLNMIAIAAVYSIYIKTTYYFDLVLVFSLLGFVGTVCFAKYLDRGRIIE